MKKMIMVIIIGLFVCASPATAGMLGVPGPGSTEEGKWLKNKIHDKINKGNSRAAKKLSEVLKSSGWDKETNKQADKEYKQHLLNKCLKDPKCRSSMVQNDNNL